MKVSVNSMNGKPYKIPQRESSDGVTERNTVAKKIILSLEDDEEEALSSRNSVSYSLRSSPTDANSPTYQYKKSVYVLEGNEDFRIILRWKDNVNVVLRGLNITTYAPQWDMCTTLMRGTPSSLFLQAIEHHCQKAMEQAIFDADDDQAAQAANDAGLDRCD